MDRVYNKGSINIMLSPQFYTMKREELPIKHQYQAKKLASSVFESLLTDDVEYQFYVYKDGEDWVFIAYDQLEISTFLENIGIKIEDISKLFFAQQYLEKFHIPFVLSDKELLATIDKTAVVIPSAIIGDSMTNRRFNEDVINKNGISFGFSNSSILEYKESIILSVIFAIFGLMFIIEGIKYSNTISSMEDEVALVLSEYPSLQSKYSRDNIAKKYKKIDTIERKKRDILKSISNLVLKGVKLVSLSINSKTFNTTLNTPNERTLIQIKNIARKKGYNTSRIGDNIIKIEGKI
jgi:hypothetical protein